MTIGITTLTGKGMVVFSRYPEQTSQAVYLIKGSYYYIEGLHKQQYGNDTFAVGVQTPDNKQYYPIPSRFLWTTTPPKPQGMLDKLNLSKKRRNDGI